MKNKIMLFVLSIHLSNSILAEDYSYEEFKKHTRHNIEEGKVVEKGFRYFQVHNVSIQGKII